MKTYFHKIEDSQRADETRDDLNRAVDERLPEYARALKRYWIASRGRVPTDELRRVLKDGHATRELKTWLIEDYERFYAEEIEGLFAGVFVAGESFAIEMEGGLYATGSIESEIMAEYSERWPADMVTRQVRAYEAAYGYIQAALTEGHPISEAEQLGLMIGSTGLNHQQVRALVSAQVMLGKVANLKPQVLKRLDELLTSGATLTADYELAKAYADAKRLHHAQAFRLGLVKSVERTWITQRDERVCKFCSALGGVTRTARDARGMYAPFNAQVPGVGRISQANTPRHHRCRCVIRYQVSAYDSVRIARAVQDQGHTLPDPGPVIPTSKAETMRKVRTFGQDVNRLIKHLPGGQVGSST